MRNKDSSRFTHGCCYITVIHHLSATLESKCLILERNIPLFGSSEPPLTQHETLTSTSKSCMTAHPNNEATQKKHQLSRTGRLFLKRLSMQLLCPVLLSSVCIGRGGYTVVSVAVELQKRCGTRVRAGSIGWILIAGIVCEGS